MPKLTTQPIIPDMKANDTSLQVEILNIVAAWPCPSISPAVIKY